MIGLDTCFLIDLYWQDSPRNKNARALFSKIANDPNIQIGIYYNCFNEFIHVITDSNRFENPFSVKEAIAVVEFWCDIDKVTVLYPSDSSFKRTLAWMNMYKLERKRINDTQMASCYLVNNITSIVSANPKDFEIFECFNTENYT